MIADITRARSPLVTKLSHFIVFSGEDVRVLDALCVNEERFEADTDIAVQGDVPRSAFVLTHGIACRYRLLADDGYALEQHRAVLPQSEGAGRLGGHGHPFLAEHPRIHLDVLRPHALGE